MSTLLHLKHRTPASSSVSHLPIEAQRHLKHSGSVFYFRGGVAQKVSRRGHLTVFENLFPIRLPKAA